MVVLTELRIGLKALVSTCKFLLVVTIIPYKSSCENKCVNP